MNNKSKYTIQLTECTKYWKDVSNLNAIPVDRYVTQRDPDFNTRKYFTIIKQLKKTKLSKENIAEILRKCKKVWIRKARNSMSY